jgi:hypothetical protein
LKHWSLGPDVNPHAIHSNLNLKMTGQLRVTRSEQASL